MSEKTGIQWTDATWNPVTGCSRVSAGCKNCYADRKSKRLQAMGSKRYAAGFEVATHTDALEIPLRWTRGRKIFVNSMSDLFHEDVPFEFVDEVFAVMALAEQHTFQILTKRPDRMLEYFGPSPELSGITRDALVEGGAQKRYFDRTGEDPSMWLAVHWPLPNVWLGVSVENQAAAEARIPLLLQTPAAVRFISAEPLLGPVDLTQLQKTSDSDPGFNALSCGPDDEGDLQTVIDWVICGGESGPGARPMHPEWARSLRDQCLADSVPFFFKQWGEWAPGENVPHLRKLPTKHFFNDCWEDCSDDWATEQDSGPLLYRCGKKASGRSLDGQEWNEFPKASVKA